MKSQVVEPSKDSTGVVSRETSALVSDDAERAVLSAILIAGASDEHRVATNVAGEIRADMFGRGAHRVIYQAMEALRATNVVVDPVTLSHQLEAHGTLVAAGGKEFIGSLLDEIPTIEHAMHHARIIRERWKRREVKALATRMASMAVDPAVNVDDVFAWASKALLPMAAGRGERGFRKIRDGLVKTMERLDARQHGEARGILPTFLPELDEKLDGGVQRGELVIVGGVPSCGKTTVVWNWLRELTLREQGAVGFVSAEMSEGMLLEAALASEAEVARGNLKNGKLSDEDNKRLIGAFARLLQQDIYIDDTVMPDIEDVVNRCRLLKVKQPNLCAIGVDFIQLLQKGDRRQGDLQASVISEIVYQLKGLAIELDIVVVALAQPNDKQIEDRPDKRPQLRDLQGSSGMRQAADHVWLLYREKMYNAGAPDVIEVNLAKQKTGAVSTVRLDWDGPRLRVLSPRLEKLRRDHAAMQAVPSTLPLGAARQASAESVR